MNEYNQEKETQEQDAHPEQKTTNIENINEGWRELSRGEGRKEEIEREREHIIYVEY